MAALAETSYIQWSIKKRLFPFSALMAFLLIPFTVLCMLKKGIIAANTVFPS
jgi:hypothetical protein